MFSLGFFSLEATCSLLRGYCIVAMYGMCIPEVRNREGDCEREQRILERICYRLCLFISLDNRKEDWLFRVDVAQTG